MNEFEYLHPSFKLDDNSVVLFNAMIDLNEMQVSQGQMEWNAASLTHKAFEAIRDEPVSELEFYNIEHNSPVMNEALLAMSRLPVSETGLEKLVLGFYKLEEPEMLND